MVTQHPCLALGRDLNRADQGRSSQTGIRHEDEIDRAHRTTTRLAMHTTRRFAGPHRIGHADRRKTLNPDAALCTATGDHLLHRDGRHEADAIPVHSERLSQAPKVAAWITPMAARDRSPSGPKGGPVAG